MADASLLDAGALEDDRSLISANPNSVDAAFESDPHLAFPDSIADDPMPPSSSASREDTKTPLELAYSSTSSDEGKYVRVHASDGHVVRKVDASTQGFYRPFKGSIVTYSYRLIVDGENSNDDKHERPTKMQHTISSDDAPPEPLVQHLDHDEATTTKLLDMCLKDMAVGQTCTFRVDSTFTKHDERAIQLTLHDVHTEAHVLDGQMLRRRVKSDGGKGNTANDGSAVTVRFREVEDAAVGGFDDDERAAVPEEEWMELEFEVGDGTAMLGVDHAVKSMRVGDVVRLRLRGEATLPDVPAELPPGTDLAYEELHVELILDKAGAARVDKFSMKARDKVSLAEDLRQRANALYKAGRIERAIKTYERGIDMFNSLQAEGDRERGTYDAAVADANRQCRKAQVPFYLNAALARVKLGRFAEARDDMLELFDLDDVTSDDERAKAHFRMGQAQVGLLDYAEAQRSFRRAMELAPSLVCADATRELKRVAQLQAAQDAKDRAVVSSALAKKQRETNGNVFYTEHEKSAISEPYRRALPKKTERAAERIDNLEAEIADIEEDEDEVDRKRREDWYNGMIRSGNMKVHMG